MLAGSVLVQVAGAEEPADAQRRIEDLNPTKKEQLLRSQERFAKLPPAQQERLRQLHQQLQQDPHSAELRRVMRGYCTWLKSLPPYRRAELRELKPAERIERIKKLRAEEAERTARAKDFEGLLHWMTQYVSRNEERLMATLPEPFRQKMAELSPPMRHRVVGFFMWQRWQMDKPEQLPPMTDDDLKDLRSQLSEPTRARLTGKPPAEQWQTIVGMVRQARRHEWASRRMRGPLPEDHEQRLDHFFEHDLSAEEQDRLLSLPGDEMTRELRRMYLGQFRAPDGPPGWPDRPDRGRRSGPPGPQRDRPPRPPMGPRHGPPPTPSNRQG